eukprot:7608730-Heterocapsa_arctica.AAC.1
MEAQYFLGRGCSKTEYRVHRLFPGNKTRTYNNAEQIWGGQIGKDRSYAHHQDEEEGFQFLCDRGSDE